MLRVKLMVQQEILLNIKLISFVSNLGSELEIYMQLKLYVILQKGFVKQKIAKELCKMDLS